MARLFNKTSQKDKRRALRNNMPAPEVLLWSRLKGKQMCGHKFRRQYGVGPYVVDFYCPALKLAIEVDGDSHFDSADAQANDRSRQTFIESFGIRFLRFTNVEVFHNIEGVLASIEQAIGGQQI